MYNLFFLHTPLHLPTQPASHQASSASLSHELKANEVLNKLVYPSEVYY